MIKLLKQFWKYIISFLIIGTIVYGAGELTERNEVSLKKVNQKYEQATELKAKYQLDGASLIRKEIKNSELDKYKNEPKDEIKITIGDKDKAEFTPDIELSRWNEVSFKIKPNLDGVATKDKDLFFNGEKVLFSTPKISFEMYEYAGGEGGYKMIWYLNKKPTTNKVEFQIETSGLDFFYQPPLTQKEIDEGAVRPENVIGSYAVYHKSKGGLVDSWGKAYGTGKFGHIYRPRICDADNNCIWGDLFIDIEAGIYRITINQDFINTAKYPVRSE